MAKTAKAAPKKTAPKKTAAPVPTGNNFDEIVSNAVTHLAGSLHEKELNQHILKQALHDEIMLVLPLTDTDMTDAEASAHIMELFDEVLPPKPKGKK